MRKHLMFPLIFCIILTCTLSFAELPHTFQAGQVAKANDVNENFQYLARASYVLKSNGAIVGDVISIDYNGATITNDKGFRFHVDNNGSAYFLDIKRYYQDQDCKGIPYVLRPLVNTVFSDIITLNSQVVVNTYYVLSTDEPSVVAIRSIYSPDSSCSNNASFTRDGFVKARENDISVTGVPNKAKSEYEFKPPITIEHR